MKEPEKIHPAWTFFTKEMRKALGQLIIDIAMQGYATEEQEAERKDLQRQVDFYNKRLAHRA